jgi:hypothetical protein
MRVRGDAQHRQVEVVTGRFGRRREPRGKAVRRILRNSPRTLTMSEPIDVVQRPCRPRGSASAGIVDALLTLNHGTGKA